MEGTTVSRSERAELKAAWGSWIAGLGDWHLFGGLTYDPRRRRVDARGESIKPGDDVAKSHVWRWLKSAPQTIGRPIEAAVVALEYQRNGWPHFHPLLRLNGGLQDGDIAGLGSAWFRAHGGNQLAAPRSTSDVCEYASKYLSKDLDRGDVIMFSLIDRVRARPDYRPRWQVAADQLAELERGA